MTIAGGEEDLASVLAATGIVVGGLGCFLTLGDSNSFASCCRMVFDIFLSDFFFLNSFIICEKGKERKGKREGEKKRRIQYIIFTVHLHCLNRPRE